LGGGTFVCVLAGKKYRQANGPEECEFFHSIIFNLEGLKLVENVQFCGHAYRQILMVCPIVQNPHLGG
jgi:hypothetical protein